MTVFESGEVRRFASSTGSRSPATLLNPIVLARLDCAPLELVVDFLLNESLPSLFITSARAFPTEARLRDWRIEFRVVRLAGFVLSLLDIVAFEAHEK